jgi:hypothetical protein
MCDHNDNPTVCNDWFLNNDLISVKFRHIPQAETAQETTRNATESISSCVDGETVETTIPAANKAKRVRRK